MMKTAFFVAFDRPYLLAFHSLLNSLIEYCPNQDIIITYENKHDVKNCNDYVEYLKPFLNNIRNKIVFVPRAYENIQDDRLYVLSEMGFLNEYDSICHIEADMYLTADFDVYFNVSSKSDSLICVRDFSDRLYTAKGYINKDGTTNYSIPEYNPEFFCVVPMWFNKSCIPYLKEVAETTKNNKPDDFGDMETLNMKALSMGMIGERVLALPNEQFVQTRFSFMNPLSRISLKRFSSDCADLRKDLNGKLRVTTQHAHYIKSIHGKFYQPEWVKFFQDQFDLHLHNSFCFNDMDFKHETEMCAAKGLKKLAFNSLNLGTQIFKFFQNRHIPFDDKFYYRAEEKQFLTTIGDLKI